MKFWIPALAIGLALFIGCETEKKPEPDLTIDPSSTTVKFGESVTLTAQGGWDYTWEILEPKHGTLSSYNGKKVTYMAPAADVTSTNASTNALEVTDIVQVHSTSNHKAKAIITIKGE